MMLMMMKKIIAVEDEDDGEFFADSLQVLINQSQYAPFKPGTLFGLHMMWDSIESDFAVAAVCNATNHKYHIGKVFHYLKKTNAKLLRH